MMGSDNDVPRPTEPEVKGKISNTDTSLPWYWQIYPFLRNTKCK